MSANSTQSNEPNILSNKKKPMTAIVKIANLAPVKVALEANTEECTTVGQHAAYLQEMINQNHGKKLGLRLDGHVSLCSIFLEDIALFNYNVKLDPESKYTFRFELEANSNGSGEQQPRDDQLNVLKGQMEKLEVQMCQVMAKQDEEKQSKVREFADLIVVPIPTKLSGNYNREKLLQLIQHGDSITSRLHIQQGQSCTDVPLVESMVDLLASSEEPGKLIGEVVIEHYSSSYYFTWPQKLAEQTPTRKTSNVMLVYNQTSSTPSTMGLHNLAEYQLSNRGFQFIVEIYYLGEANFNKLVAKFHYRRLQQ